MPTTKPTKPSITLPSAFGTSPSNVKTAFTGQELIDGYSASIPQVLDGGNVNWLNDTLFKYLTYTTALCDWLNGISASSVPFINSSNQLDSVVPVIASADNTFTGTNTFTATPVIHNSAPRMKYIWSAISSNTTAPSATIATDPISIVAEDNSALAIIYHQRKASTNNAELIFRQWNPSGNSYYDMIYHVENAFSYLTLVHSPAATDNSKKVATTEWVAGHRCTTAATTTSSASVDAPAYVIENYKNSDRWYRVWSDGWIEQGGIITSGVSVNSNGTQSLWKSFTDTKYTLQLTPGVDATAAGFDTGTQGFVCYTRRTTSDFKWKITHTGTAYYANTITWYACGY